MYQPAGFQAECLVHLETVKKAFFATDTYYIIAAAYCINTLVQRAKPPRQYTFSHYSTATGMLSNQVNTVVQDETGYIWAGTTDGLVSVLTVARYKNFSAQARTIQPPFL